VSGTPVLAEHPSTETTLATVNAVRIRDISPRWIAALLVVLTLTTYWPAFSNGFVNYDDDGYVTQNHFVQNGLSLSGIGWAWRATIMANWHPLTWISHMADVQMFRMNPAGHHASSVFLHAVNVVLLFFLLHKATGCRWRSAMVAAVFAVHPLNVECVAWVSERKSLLCAAFLFLALFAYGWYVRKPGVGRYVLVALLFALGLAAKPMVITLPFALLLLDYWPLRRLPIPDSSEARALFRVRLRQLALEKLPLLLLSLASAFITVIAQARTNTIAANTYLSIPVRFQNALWSYLMYLEKAVWPTHLAIFYPHPENTLALWKPLLATLLLLFFTGYCLRHLQQRYLLVGWLWYLGCLVPVIGIVQVGRQAMADRYAYTPLLGIMVIAVWSIADRSSEFARRTEVLGLVSALALIFFSVLSWRQTTYWRDSFSLFEHALEVTPANFIAENNLGQAYVEVGRPDLAYAHFLRSTQEKPHFGLAHYNLGVVLAGQNRNDDARKEFLMAIQYGQETMDVAHAYHNLGVALLAEQQWNDARAAFSEAIRLMPNKPSSYLARGFTEFHLADYGAAESDFATGASFAPDANAYYWLGRSREKRGDLSGATEAYRRALALAPGLDKAKDRLNAIVSGRPLPFLQQDEN
jgi:Flp pilus assembly protein TadD